MAAIVLKKVIKDYKMGEVIVNALKGIDMIIEKGDFIAIMGSSGSGKSTLLNMIGCLDLPTKGEIYLEGNNIKNLSEKELSKLRGKKIGFIFQRFNLISSLSAKENVMLAMTFQKKSREFQKKRAEYLLKLVKLEHRLDHKPNQLSGGEQQRVAIARALANDPEILLADEPTGNLDSVNGNEVILFLQKLHEKGKTIILVTHDNNLAKNAKRVVRIRDGGLE